MLKRCLFVATPIVIAALAPCVLLAGLREQRETADRMVARHLALYDTHYAEPTGVALETLRAQSDRVGSALFTGYKAFVSRFGLRPSAQCQLPEGSNLPSLAFKEALIRFRERNAARLQRVAVTGAFNTASFSDLRPDVLAEYLVQAAATETLLDLVDSAPISSVTARVSSSRPHRTRPSEILDVDRLVRVAVRIDCRATLEGLDAFLVRLAGEGSPFVVERLEVDNAFEVDTERRNAELACRIDVVALRVGLLEKPRYSDQRPAWVREVEGL